MKVVSVINYKGGVGKTSLTTNLGAELAFRGKRVLLLDLDAQASLTFSFITPDEWSDDFEDSGTIKEWFDAAINGAPISLSSVIQKPIKVNEKVRAGQLDVIYSHLGLINVDLELATQLGGANLQQAKKNFLAVHGRLARALSEVKEAGNYDLILIDCPPNFNIVTKTALVASDYILVPTRPDQLSTLGIDYLSRSITQLVEEYNEFASVQSSEATPQIDPKMMGIVFTMIQEYGGGPMSAHRAYIQRVRNQASHPVFDAYIKRNDTLFAEAPAYGVPVVLSHHANHSHQSVVDGLEEVATEFTQKVGL